MYRGFKALFTLMIKKSYRSNTNHDDLIRNKGVPIMFAKFSGDLLQN